MRFFALYIVVSLCLWAGAATGSDKDVRRYEFDRPLGGEWEHIGKPLNDFYEIGDGRLRLFCGLDNLKDGGQPTFVGLRTDTTAFSVTTKMFFFETLDGDEAGLSVYQSPQGYVQCCLSNQRGSHRLRLRLMLRNVYVQLADKPLSYQSDVWMRVEDDGQNYNFSYSLDGTKYLALYSLDRSLLRPVVVGGGTGIVVGLYAFKGTTKLQAGPSYADFDFFELRDGKSP